MESKNLNEKKIINYNETIKDAGDYTDEKSMIMLKDHFIKKYIELTRKGMIKRANKNMRLAFFVYFLYYSGRRVSEVLGNTENNKYNPLSPYRGLIEDDINFEISKIRFGILKKNHIKKSKYTNLKTKFFDEENYKRDLILKGPKFEWIEYHSYYMQKIKEYLAWAKENNMVGDLEDVNDKRIFPMTRGGVYIAFKVACDTMKLYLPSEKVRSVYKMGVNGKPMRDSKGCKVTERLKTGRVIHPHSLRHGFASAMIKKSKTPQDYVVLKNMLAHSSFKTTEAYIHLFSGEQSKVHGRLFGIEEKEEEDEDEI